MYVHPSIDKSSPYLYRCTDENNYISIIKELLNKCETTSGKDNKTLVVRDVFTLICSNIWFLDLHDKFKKTVISKLVELYNTEESVKDEINEYHKNITGCYIIDDKIQQTTTQNTNTTTIFQKIDNFDDIGFSNTSETLSFLQTPQTYNGITIDFKDNANTIYQGELKDGKRNGYGKYWNNEFSYKGEWKDDMPNGYGIYTCNKNRKYMFNDEVISYEGNWINGIKEDNGNSKEVYVNGEFYIGQFKNNMINGIGKMYYSNGKIKYDSDKWINNIPFTDCYCKTIIQLQTAYVPIINNKKIGYCRIVNDTNGSISIETEINEDNFTGNFKIFYNKKIEFRGINTNGYFDGYIEKYSSDGLIVKKGIYVNGSCVEGQEYLNGKLTYDGEYVSCKHGQTLSILYIMTYNESFYNGKGKLYKTENGKNVIYNGIFKYGVRFRGIIYEDSGNIIEDCRKKEKKI